jgi:hypothetical protein
MTMLIVYTNYHIGNGAAVQDCLQQQFSDTTAELLEAAPLQPRCQDTTGNARDL